VRGLAGTQATVYSPPPNWGGNDPPKKNEGDGDKEIDNAILKEKHLSTTPKKGRARVKSHRFCRSIGKHNWSVK